MKGIVNATRQRMFELEDKSPIDQVWMEQIIRSSSIRCLGNATWPLNIDLADHYAVKLHEAAIYEEIMIGLINSAILLAGATNRSERIIIDPEGYRVAAVTGEFLERWKERALAAEQELERISAECDELAADNIDLQTIVQALEAKITDLHAAPPS